MASIDTTGHRRFAHQFFGAASTPDRASTASGRRAPSILIAEHGRVQFRELRRRESNGSRSDVLEHVRHLCRARDGHDPGLLRHQPRQRDLGGSGTLPFGPRLHQLDELQILGQVLWRESGLALADVTVGESRPRVDGTGQKPHPERAPRDEADAELLAERDDHLLRPAPQHRILVLNGTDAQRRMGAAQRLRSHLREAPVQDLALRHQLLDGAGDVFDRDLRVDAMLIEEIDAVGAKTLEHALDRELDVVRAAVEARAPRARLRIDVPAELGGDDHLVPEGRDAFAQDPLDLMRAVGLGGVEERDTAVEGRPDDVEHLGPARDRRLIGAGHVLDAEADARDFQLSQPSSPRRMGDGPTGVRCLRRGLRIRPAQQRRRRETAACPRNPRRPSSNLRSLAMCGRPLQQLRRVVRSH